MFERPRTGERAVLVRLGLGVPVDSEDLLADGVCPSGEEARLGRSTPVFNTQDSGNVDAFVAEVGEKSISGGIITDGGDR